MWIGHAGDGCDFVRLFDSGIRGVIQLAAEEPPLVLPRSLISLRFPLSDGADNPRDLLSLAIQAVSSVLTEHVPTLVCCSMGLSRSPCIVAAALSLFLHEPPEVSLKRLMEHRSCDISGGLWKDVLEILASRRTNDLGRGDGS